jgi:hypothetical protein
LVELDPFYCEELRKEHAENRICTRTRSG